MKMNVNDRIEAMRLLPGEGSAITWKLILEAHDALGFSDAEHKKLGFENTETPAGTVTTWNPKKDRPVEIKLGDKATEWITEALNKLNGEEKLSLKQLILFEKFCVPELTKPKGKGAA